MNYVRLQATISRLQDDLHGFGVPVKDAEQIARYVEASAISAEASYRKDNQFLIDLDRAGTRAMAERLGISERSIQRRKQKLNRKKYDKAVRPNVG